ncbi:SET domain-containing protein [Panus rudis PR-1116 ss-1]|nr:SET domain-containing protein [Panus rudis PR-1116 ss-1]
MVTIPKSAILSVRSCSFSGSIPFAPYGQAAQLGLALAVYIELLKGRDSRWFGYLQSLPQEPVDIALFWGSDELDRCRPDEAREDRKLARTWVVGTEIDRELYDEDGVCLLDGLREYYHTVAERLLSSEYASRPQPYSIAGFMHAYSLVSSRAFLVDAYHGLAMVPIADAFNHAQENDVHLESDYDVCVICGSNTPCPHDETSMVANDDGRREGESIDTCDMVTNRPVAAGGEVFNTYGERLTNAQLLVRYGFALEGNENDMVSWQMDDLPPAPWMEREAFRTNVYEPILRAWPRDLRWVESERVYNPPRAYTVVRIEDRRESPTRRWPRRHLRPALDVNGDAKLSHPLWVYCALCATVRVRGPMEDVDELLRFLGQLAEMVHSLEGEAAGSEGEDGDAGEEEGVGHHRVGDADSDEPRMEVLDELVRTVEVVCREREKQLRGGRIGRLGEMLDNLGPGRVRTRYAIAQVLSERTILESCLWAWQQLGAGKREEVVQ